MAIITDLRLTNEEIISLHLLYKKNNTLPFSLGMKLGKKMREELCSKYKLDTPAYGQFHEEIHKFKFEENQITPDIQQYVEDYISNL